MKRWRDGARERGVGAMFALNTKLDAPALSRVYANGKRLQVADFLTRESARALSEELAHGPNWRLTANRDEQIIDFSPERQAQGE